MIVKNVTPKELRQALDKIQAHFGGNLNFLKLEPLGASYRVRLRVKDSKGKGAGVGHTGRRLVSACWHTYGYFFEALLAINDKAVIKSLRFTITKEGGNWQDYNIGSIIYPLCASEACECYNKNIREILRNRR